MRKSLTSIILLATTSACTLAPTYKRPVAAVPAVLPDPTAGAEGERPAALSYRDVFRDEKLVALIDQALANNQNLKAAYANARAARAQVSVTRSSLFPQIDVSADVTKADSSNEIQVGGNASVGARGRSTGGPIATFRTDAQASWEIDLFGRIQSLSNAALNEYLATDAARRGVRLSVVAGVANAYLTLATDRSLLEVAKETSAAAAKSVDLTRSLLEGGVAARTDLRQAETVLAQAQSDQANLETLIEQDRNALQLLVGAPVPDALLPTSIEAVDTQIAEVPAGLDSSILLRRPDVVQAEYTLRAANARIGAARAAFLPRIALTALGGFASTTLADLFVRGARTWSVAPSATLPIFTGGANVGNLRVSNAQRDQAVAQYQTAIQTAFRDVSNALARRATIDEQYAASSKLDAAAQDSLTLADARYRNGIDPYLTLLDARRTAYGAARTLAQTRLLKAQNLVAIYQSLGGDELIDATPGQNSQLAMRRAAN
jgi:multidrug efflux system outer membrane protein